MILVIDLYGFCACVGGIDRLILDEVRTGCGVLFKRQHVIHGLAHVALAVGCTHGGVNCLVARRLQITGQRVDAVKGLHQPARGQRIGELGEKSRHLVNRQRAGFLQRGVSGLRWDAGLCGQSLKGHGDRRTSCGFRWFQASRAHVAVGVLELGVAGHGSEFAVHGFDGGLFVVLGLQQVGHTGFAGIAELLDLSFAD